MSTALVVSIDLPAVGTGPHFCTGAGISRALIAEIALPMVFDALPDMQLAGDAKITGWAFRGLTSLPVRW